jgi:hypothetical protein
LTAGGRSNSRQRVASRTLDVEVDSRIPAQQAAFRQQGVFGEARMQLRNQFHGRSRASGVHMHGIQRPVAQVIIDVPHPLAASLGGDAQQDGAVIAQANRRQPPFDEQLIPVSDLRLHAFGDHRPNPAMDDKAQAVNAMRARGEPLLLEELAGGAKAAEYGFQQLAELSQSGLTTLFKQLVQAFDHVSQPAPCLQRTAILPLRSFTPAGRR